MEQITSIMSSQALLQDEILELSEISSVPSSPGHQKLSATSRFTENTISNAPTTSAEITFSKSDGLSYRDKLKERFNSVKQRIVCDDFRIVSKKISTLNSNLKLLQNENKVTESEMVTRRTGAGDGCYEEHLFFCEEHNQNKTEEKMAKKEVDDANEWNNNDQLFQFKLPESMNYIVKMQEKDLLWQPKRVSFSSVEITNTATRAIEGDGLYNSANMSKIRKAELILLHQRLRTSERIKWFDHDGTLNTLETPYAKFSLRPSTKSLLQLTEYCPTLKYDVPCEEVVINGNANILNLQILSLTFKHHPLFSAEHVLQQKLIDYYEIYQHYSSQNKLQILSNKLDALRSSKECMGKQAGDATNMNLHREITKLRENLFEEGRIERNTVKGLLQIWKTIKNLREHNQYSNTSIKLIIKKENVEDISKEKIVFEKQIKQTIEEITEEYNQEFEAKMSDYKKEYQLWKNLENTNKEKPKKPEKDFSEIEIKQEVAKKFNESFKSPGEPKLHFEINYDNEITADIQDKNEKLRRTCVNTTKIWLRIYCKDLKVCETKHVSLNDRFVCVFEETYSIELNNYSTANVSVQIIEQPGALLKRKCGEIGLMLPCENDDENESVLRKGHFIKDEIIQYNKHSAVGGGVKFLEIFPDLNFADTILNTSGFVSYSVGWDFEDKPKSHLIQENSLLFDGIFNKNGMINVDELVKWSENKNLVQKDQQNAVLCDYVKDYFSCEINDNYFRMNPLQKDFIFCNHKDIEQNIRFIVLQHRNNNVPEFSGMVVPNRLKEIPFNVLENYLQRLNNCKHDFILNTKEDIESKRSKARTFLRQTFMNIFQKCRNSEENISFEDVLDEKYLVHFDLLLQKIITKVISFFSLRKNIDSFQEKPIWREQIATEDGAMGKTNVKIIVHLQSSLNIPYYQNDEKNGDVKSFVTIEYNTSDIVSTSAVGTNCIWNEELVLPLDTTHTDYLNPDSLNGFITIRLFEEQINETKTDRIFVGSLNIPISAICNSLMEGFFKMKTPYLLPDCLQNHEKVITGSTTSNLQQLTTSHRYLLMKIFCTPSLPKLSPSMEEWPCNEPFYIKNHILHWNDSYNTNYPSRKFSALVIDMNAKSNCITRYIRPLEPPQLNTEGFDVTAEQCARYVSMIPFTEYNKFYENVCMTSNQLLKFMVGSILDHAIALTCYLLALNVDAWLLLGFGIPNGNTSYVLIREHITEVSAPTYYVFDVISGIKYSILDIYCPLQMIYCVINNHNIWANLQRCNCMSNIRFDFTRRFDWTCLFDNKIESPTNTIQTKLNYVYEDHVQELEMRIEKKIKRKVIKMRKFERTVWNNSVAKVYKSIMRKLEFNSLHGKSNKEVYMEVKRAINDSEANGYIFNTPYTKASSIVKQVLKSVEHLIQTNNIEFATTVYVHPYPANVYSIWLLFAIITKID